MTNVTEPETNVRRPSASPRDTLAVELRRVRALTARQRIELARQGRALKRRTQRVSPS